MNTFSKMRRWGGIFLATMLALVSCGGVMASEGALPAQCVIVVGDGKNGDDGDPHYYVYPNDDKYTVGGGEDSWFVWCNARNFKINDGTEFHLDGNRIGDFFSPLQITTPSGVVLNVSLSMYWTLNQDKAAMTEFWSICLKYRCASAEAIDPDSNNFASPGWNGFLAENVPYALLASARTASVNITDDIWLTGSPQQFDLLADGIAEHFPAEFRYLLGFQNDIFCGSNTSQWQDPNHPGDDGNVFNCAPVRIKVDKLTIAPDSQQTPAGLAVLNQWRYDNAHILYGDNTSNALAEQDIVRQCGLAQTQCTVIVGDPNDTQLPVVTPASKEEGE